MDGTTRIGSAQWITLVLVLTLVVPTASADTASGSNAKLHGSLKSRFLEVSAGEPVKTWVLFQAGKGLGSPIERDAALKAIREAVVIRRRLAGELRGLSFFHPWSCSVIRGNPPFSFRPSVLPSLIRGAVRQRGSN